MASLVRSAPYTLAIWWRHFLVWQRTIWSSLALQVVNPILFLFAYGFGLGAVIEEIDGLDYLSFVLPGMMAYSAMFTASFETSVGAYARFAYQKTWDAMLATPVTLIEVLLGEALWASGKALLSVAGVLLVGWVWGGIGWLLGALLGLLALGLAAFAFAAFGLAATAHARSWEFFNYFFTFWVTPNFMFSGVFFPIDRLPDAIEALAWVLPMTHLIQVIRPLSAGLPLDPALALLHVAYLAALAALTFWLAWRRLRARMFD
jgi:lipooligosaccharide transport system permease protein